MAVTGATPPPLSTDLVDTRSVRFRTSPVTGQPEIVPGSLTASSPWLIWFNTNFTSQQSGQDAAVLEAMDTGYGTEAVEALRQAQEALILSATQPVTADSAASLNDLARTLATQSQPADLTSSIYDLQRAISLLACCTGRNYGVISGTHATRALTPAGGMNLNRIYYETDRRTIYISISNVWTFAAGIMVAAAASRPADLTTTDAGFFFLASDTLLFSYWTGAAWVAVTPAMGGAYPAQDITGTFPNPVLNATGVAAATYGDATHVAQVTFDVKGRASAAANVAITFPPTTGFSGTVDLAALTGGGTQGTLTVVNGLITAYTPPT